jgi:CRP/FNR family transcriptional regulator, cyclic AMP receptor protein
VCGISFVSKRRLEIHSTHDDHVGGSRHQIAALVDVDWGLGRQLTAKRRAAARNEIPVRIVGLERGPWAASHVAASDAGHLGLLVVDGLVGRELLADDVASMELLGPGDLIRPWDEPSDVELLQALVRWSALSPTRLALLDRQLAGRLAAYPEIHCALLERTTARSRRLGVLQAISHLTRVDRRLLTLLWHLAERWGRVTPRGILVPLTLSHRMLGKLFGARRPTVSSAIGALTGAGEVLRNADGTWLLTGSPVGTPVAEVSRFVPPRRAMLPPPVGALGV